MRSDVSVDMGLITKPASSLFSISGQTTGVSLTSVGFKSPSYPGRQHGSRETEYKKQDAERRREERNCLELPADVKAAIQNAALNGESKEETMKKVEDNYADLNLTVKVLGSVYDSAVRLLGSLQRSETNFSIATLATLTEEDKFKENKKSQQPRGNFGMTKAIPYLNEVAEYRLINAGFESKKITIEGLDSAAKTLRTDQETFVFLKIVPTKTREDSIVPVNNGYLLKV